MLQLQGHLTRPSSCLSNSSYFILIVWHCILRIYQIKVLYHRVYPFLPILDLQYGAVYRKIDQICIQYDRVYRVFEIFSFYCLGPAIKACGGGIKSQYFAFSVKQFPFYSYGGAIRPAGAVLKPSILLFKPSIFHFTLMAARLVLRGQH